MIPGRVILTGLAAQVRPPLEPTIPVARIPTMTTPSPLAAALAVAFLLTACSGPPTESSGPPAGLAIQAGNNQEVAVGFAVPIAPSVKVHDATGRGVPGVTVRFEVMSGGGSVTGDSVVTGPDGVAAVGSWRVGSSPVANALRALTPDHPFSVAFDATARPGTPTSVQVVVGAGAAAVVESEVLPKPAVRLRDNYGNPVPNAPVTWQVVSGGGSLIGPTQTISDAQGLATVGGWLLGQVSGLNRLRATAGTGASTTIDALGIGEPAAIIPISPTSQVGYANFAVAKVPRVRVVDEFDAPIQGVPVQFSLSGGTGTIQGDLVNTNSDGVATLGDWKIGSSGASQVTATVPGSSGPTADFTATGAPRDFTIDVRFVGSIPSADLRDDYVAAAMRWMEIIVGDLPDVAVNAASPCLGSFGEPAINEVVDDVVIFARIRAIDGRGGVLGQATACRSRSGTLLTSVGGMEFDVADAQSLHNSGQFTAVAIHEMGHVLGFLSSRFSSLGLITGNGGADPYFTGAAAVAAWPSLGVSYTGNPVPLENTGGLSTAYSHWRESVIETELMTGWIEPAGVYMPLSAITVGLMADIGYQVDMSKADPFIPSLLATPAQRGRRFNLHEIQPKGWVP